MPAPLLSTSESSYILSGLQSDPPFRHDRRSLTEFRELHLQTGVAAQANGSARVTIGGTTVLVGIKAEVEDVDGEGKEDDDEAAGDGVEFGKEASGSGARVVCSIECAPALVHTLESRKLDALASDLTALLGTVLASTSSPLSAAQLEIVPGARAWTLYLDAQLLSLDGGNVPDALFAAAHAAMRDARLPRTRAVAFEAPTGSSGSGHLQDTTVPPEGKGAQGGALSNEGGDLDRMGIKGMLKSKAVDFELDDLWDEGAPLQGAEDLPVCVTVNLLPDTYASFVDATAAEEHCAAVRLLILASKGGTLHGVKQLGSGEVPYEKWRETIKLGVSYAQQLCGALDLKLSYSATDAENGASPRDGGVALGFGWP